MDTIYLNDFKETSNAGRIIRAWNSGSTLSEAVQRLESWHNIPRSQIIPFWRKLYKQGTGCVKFRPRAETNTDPAYLAWKGIIGPGKQLRDIIIAEHLT